MRRRPRSGRFARSRRATWTSATSTPGRRTGRRSCCCTAGRTTSTASRTSTPLLTGAGLPRRRPVPPWLRLDPLPVGRDASQRRAGRARRRRDRPDGRARDRAGRSSPGSTGAREPRTSSRRCGPSAAGASSPSAATSSAAGRRTGRRCRRPRSWRGGTSSTSRPSAVEPATSGTGREFARLIWRTASPHWQFDDATFERSAASFDNPDHVDIVIHNYRWRIGLPTARRGSTRSRAGSPRRRRSRFRRSRSKATRTARRTPSPRRTGRSSPGRTSTGASPAASATTSRRKHPRHSRRRSSTSRRADHAIATTAGQRHHLVGCQGAPPRAGAAQPAESRRPRSERLKAVGPVRRYGRSSRVVRRQSA